MKRLGKNHGGYRGETIDINRILRNVTAAAQSQGWEIAWLPAQPEYPLLTLHHAATKPRNRFYISAGIHGDEPAGPLAVLRLLQTTSWPEDVEAWICPCLNPTGFALNRRENSAGADLNRDYLHVQSAETQAHVAWLKSLPPIDASFCLHEDWEANGFYLYELNPDRRPSLAETIIDVVQPICPIDHSDQIEGRDAHRGMIRPSHVPSSRTDWPEAFFLIQNNTRLSYTLETPSDFPMETRVEAMVAALRHTVAAR